jgi:hypothetical protein
MSDESRAVKRRDTDADKPDVARVLAVSKATALRAQEAHRLRGLAAETADLRFFRAAEALETPEKRDLLGEEIAALRRVCDDSGIRVSVHGTVCEADAAQLVERSKRSLERWRYEGRELPCVMSGCRARYELREIAIWRLRNKIPQTPTNPDKPT